MLPAGLLAAAGLAGLLHDAGNLAVTQLSADRTDPSVVAVAGAILLTAKWTVNLAGLLWVAATQPPWSAYRCRPGCGASVPSPPWSASPR